MIYKYTDKARQDILILNNFNKKVGYRVIKKHDTYGEVLSVKVSIERAENEIKELESIGTDDSYCFDQMKIGGTI